MQPKRPRNITTQTASKELGQHPTPMFFKWRGEIGVDGYHKREQGYHMSKRRRQNLIAFRTTEGTALEARHQQALANGESMKAIVESWAETFSLMTKASEQEGTDENR